MGQIPYSIAIRSDKPGTKKVNVKSTKAYPVLQRTETLTESELAAHIAAHGSKFTRGDITAVIVSLVDCAREMLLEGKVVKLGELGTLRLSAKTTGSDTAADCTADNIKELNVKFNPGKVLMNLRADAEFECVPSRAAQADAVTAARSQETLSDDGDDDGQHLGD